VLVAYKTANYDAIDWGEINCITDRSTLVS
ncbi:MAG: hypothetical protein RLZZ569_758, partial [Bacteroidota bacterium]